MKNLKFLIAVALLTFAFQDEILRLIPDSIKPVSIVVEVTKPADEFIAFSKDFVSEISNKTDVYELAILNDEYASELISYKAPSTDQVNTIYKKVMKEVYASKYLGKYPIYKEGVLLIFKEVQGLKERSMSAEDLVRLSNLFRGLSWNLAEKLVSK